MEDLFGEWGNFRIKLIQPEDHPKILQHLREYFCYPALYRLNYEKSMEEDCIAILQRVLQGPQLSIYAEDWATGKVAATRIVTLHTCDADRIYDSIKHPIFRSILKFYMSILDDGNIFQKYPYEVIPHMFAITTATEFQGQGLGTEMYRRSKQMLKDLGHKVVIVGYISPFSREAAIRNGFIETSRKLLISASNDETGEPLNPNAEPGSFLNLGIFEL